eukprot:SAG31_NODE_16985_length_687_cov_2.057823_2_plen_73_part_01
MRLEVNSHHRDDHFDYRNARNAQNSFFLKLIRRPLVLRTKYLVYSQWFIDRDTRVIEIQPHHLIPLYIPTIEK